MIETYSTEPFDPEPRLRQLLICGDWVDPGMIGYVSANAGGFSKSLEKDFPPSVTVLIGRGDKDQVTFSKSITCKSYEEAQRVRDAIAAMANGVVTPSEPES